MKTERDAIKKYAETLLPLSIPIVEDIVRFLKTSPRLNPKTLREKLQDLSRAIGDFNTAQRYVDGVIMERDAYVDYFEDTTKNSEANSTNSETTTTTVPEPPVWDEWQSNEGERKTRLNNSWAQKLIDTTNKPFRPPPPGLEENDEVILPLMAFPKSESSDNERLERTNTFLKTTLQNVNKNAVQFEQKSKEWERLYFAELAENQKLVSENQRLLSENCSIAAEVEAVKKKLGAIQDFFLTKFF